jgi:hypothetical protein
MLKLYSKENKAQVINKGAQLMPIGVPRLLEGHKNIIEEI